MSVKTHRFNWNSAFQTLSPHSSHSSPQIVQSSSVPNSSASDVSTLFDKRVICIPEKDNSLNDCDNPRCMSIGTVINDPMTATTICNKCGLTKDQFQLYDEYQQEYDKDTQAGLSSYKHVEHVKIDRYDMGHYDEIKLHKLVKTKGPQACTTIIQSKTMDLERVVDSFLEQIHCFAFTQAFKSKVVMKYQAFEKLKKEIKTKQYPFMMATMMFVCEIDKEEPSISFNQMLSPFESLIHRAQAHKITANTQPGSNHDRVKQGQVYRLQQVNTTVKSYLHDIRHMFQNDIDQLTVADIVDKHWKSIRQTLEKENMPRNMVATIEPLIIQLKSWPYCQEKKSKELKHLVTAACVVRLDRRKFDKHQMNMKTMERLIGCSYTNIREATKLLRESGLSNANNRSLNLDIKQQQTSKSLHIETTTIKTFADDFDF